MTTYKTAESVCKGHPDKLCDLIADNILDACLRKDRASRVACEVMATKGKIIVAGEITCSEKVDVRFIVRNVLREVGYNPWKFTVFVFVHRQSADIAAGVDTAIEARNGICDPYGSVGAGDQGTVYGYATKETREYLPLPLVLSHRIAKRIDECREGKLIKGILPDGKCQVTVEYEDGKPKRVKAVVISVQHEANKTQEQLRTDIMNNVLWQCFEDFPMDDDTEILINPSGRFVASPQIRRCLPSSQMSPCLEMGVSGNGSSKSSSFIPPTILSLNNASISAASKPVRDTSKPLAPISFKRSVKSGISNSPDILLSATFKAFSFCSSMSSTTQSTSVYPSATNTLYR
jgi:hypothetical protein